MPFPAVSDAKSAVKEIVGFVARNLEADKAFTRDNGALAFAAINDCFPFHGSPPALCLVFLVGQLVSDNFQVLVHLLQACASMVDGCEHGSVVESSVRSENRQRL